MANELDPSTLEGAQYSLPYSLALALIRGPDCLVPLSEDALHDQAAVAIAAKIRLHVVPEYDARFPRDIPMHIEIVTPQGVFAEENAYPKGEADNPMTWNDLRDKYHAIVDTRLQAGHADRLFDAVRRVGEGELAPLSAILSCPAPFRPAQPRE